MRAPWVRQALAYATNRQAVVTQIFKKFNPNQQVLQNQELAEVTNFGRTGDPTAPLTPAWPRLNAKQLVMSLAPGGDSELVSTDQLAMAHDCQFWDRVAPKP